MIGRTYLVAVSGRKEHGKTTLAEAIRDYLVSKRITAAITGLSEPMYAIARIITADSDFAKNKIYQLVPGTFLSGTEVLQKIGSECFRDVFGDDIWGHRLVATVGSYGDPMVGLLPDCRMPFERNQMDFGIFVESTDGHETAQNVDHRTEKHHDQLKTRANIVVYRTGDSYSVPVESIANSILKARRMTIYPRSAQARASELMEKPLKQWPELLQRFAERLLATGGTSDEVLRFCATTYAAVIEKREFLDEKGLPITLDPAEKAWLENSCVPIEINGAPENIDAITLRK